MKQIKLLLILGLVILSFSACKKDPVVYNFEKKDTEKLLSNYQDSILIIFKNELGDTKRYLIERVTQENVEYTVPRGEESENKDNFFYELKTFHLKDIETKKIVGLYLHRFPIDLEKAVHNVYYKYRSHLMGNICNTPFKIDQKLSEREVNGTLYEDVLEIQNANFQENDYLNIKSLYYDIYYGIIEFVDGDNHQWKFAETTPFIPF